VVFLWSLLVLNLYKLLMRVFHHNNNITFANIFKRDWSYQLFSRNRWFLYIYVLKQGFIEYRRKLRDFFCYFRFIYQEYSTAPYCGYLDKKVRLSASCVIIWIYNTNQFCHWLYLTPEPLSVIIRFDMID
jgi:hypothetical protein